MYQIKNDFKNLLTRFADDDVIALAGQLAYSLLLSFFPLLIFIMTMIGYSDLSSQEVLTALQRVLPDNAFELVATTVIEIVDSRKGNLLSFSIIITLWAASSGFRAVIKGLNKAYDEEEGRPIWKVWVVSLFCIFALVIIIIGTLLLLIFGDLIGNTLARYLTLSPAFNAAWDTFRYLIMLSSMVFVFAALYHYTPSRRLNWKEVFPGALFTTLGWLVTSLGFSYYVNNFANYSRIYGGIGAVIVLMVWLFLSSVMIILGGEVNAVLAFDREGKQKPPCKRY